MWPNTQETADLVTFTEEILNGKLNFSCSVSSNTFAPYGFMIQEDLIESISKYISVSEKKDWSCSKNYWCANWTTRKKYAWIVIASLTNVVKNVLLVDTPQKITHQEKYYMETGFYPSTSVYSRFTPKIQFFLQFA